MDRTVIKKLGVAVFVADLLFIVIYLAFSSRGETSWLLHRMFDLDAEAAIPAWYSSAQLLLIGALFLFAGVTDRRDRTVGSAFLLVIGMGFVFLSADEVVSIHETMTVVLRRYEFLPRFSGGHGIWIPIYLAVGAGFLGLTAKSWLRLWQVERRGTTILLVGALVFFVGAVGLEILSYGSLRDPDNRRLYILEVAAEEGTELFGVSIMLIGTAVITSILTSAGAASPDRNV